MSDRTEDTDQTDGRSEADPERLGGGDLIGVLAVSTFLSAIGLVTFFTVSAVAS